MITIVQQFLNALSLGAIYALFSLGYALVFSILGVLNLAHSAIFMWGAFIGLVALDPEHAPLLLAIAACLLVFLIPAALVDRFLVRRFLRGNQRLLARVLVGLILWQAVAFVVVRLAPQLPETLAIPPLLAFVFASVSAGLLSIVLEFVAFRPLRYRQAARLAQLISSIGAALVLVNIAQFGFEALYNRAEAFYPGDVALLPGLPTDTIILGELRVDPVNLVVFVVSFVLLAALQLLIARTAIGQQMRIVAYDQETARLLGIDVSRVYVFTFFLAGLLGGAAGVLFGLDVLNITPNSGDDVALVGLTAIVLGGLGNIQGAVLGGFLVAAIQTFSTALGGSSFRDALVFVLLFLVLLVRPQGLLGSSGYEKS